MQRRNPHSTVISLGSAKEAALYFEHVLPIDFGFPAWAKAFAAASKGEGDYFDELLRMEVPFSEGFDETILKSLLPDGKLAFRAYMDLFAVSLCFWSLPLMRGDFDKAVLPEAEHDMKFRENYRRAGLDYDDAIELVKKTNSFDLGEFVARNIHRYNEILGSLGLSRAPTWHGAFEFMHEHLRQSEPAPITNADYAVAIKDLNLVDASKVPWEAIVELRKDSDSFEALRAFRLFFAENFSNKDASYVSDKLNSLLYEYEATVRFWGFDTARKSMAVAVSQQTVAATAMGTLASAVAGAPLAMVAGAGAVITLSSCLLEFGQIYVDAKKAELLRPLRYLTRMKSLPSQ